MSYRLDVERPMRIAVFRALVLGDLLVAMPALRALRRACPAASIVLVGLESMRDVVARFDDLVDELVPFPGHDGFPEQPLRADAWPGFVDGLRARDFDLAIQMHGSGENANGIVARFGARANAGFFRPGDGRLRDDPRDVPDRCFVAWDDGASELARCLSLVGALGAPVDDPAIRFPLDAVGRAGWQALRRRHGLDGERFVVVHAGARWPSRRWPVDRFAAVADRLARADHRIVLTGAIAEKPLVDALAARLRGQGVAPVDLCGATPLGVLAAMLADAALVVCNDTGISHVAAGVGAPSVVVASGSDVARWAPEDHALHRVVWRDAPCRPCGHFECPIGHPCALDVAVDDVVDEALGQLSRAAGRPLRASTGATHAR